MQMENFMMNIKHLDFLRGENEAAKSRLGNV